MSHHTVALEERDRRFMANERRAMAVMDAIREANRKNAMRVAHAASIVVEEAMTIAAEESAIDATAKATAALEATAAEQATAHTRPVLSLWWGWMSSITGWTPLSDGGAAALEEFHDRHRC
jgi:hypothetical protein